MATATDWMFEAAREICLYVVADPTRIRVDTVQVRKLIVKHSPYKDHIDYIPLRDHVAQVHRLKELLRHAKREHVSAQFVDCPKANPTYLYNVGQPCTCGADIWNAKIDEALRG